MTDIGSVTQYDVQNQLSKDDSSFTPVTGSFNTGLDLQIQNNDLSHFKEIGDIIIEEN